MQQKDACLATAHLMFDLNLDAVVSALKGEERQNRIKRNKIRSFPCSKYFTIPKEKLLLNNLDLKF